MRFIYTKAFIIFSAVLVFIFIALVMQTKGWLAPLEQLLVQLPRPAIVAVNFITQPIATAIGTITNLPSLVSENHNMQIQLADLNQKQVELEQLRLQNELLREELGFVAKSKFNLVPCTVLSMDTQNTSDAIILNCGEGEGVKPGQAVISNGYLAAKIVHVGKYNSTALLITSSQSSIDAKTSRSNSEGVVKGSFGTGLMLDLVSQSSDIQTGDLIVTAGIDSLVPKDILIGSADQVLSNNNDLFKRLTVVSPIKANRLDYVFVVNP